jgi:hypothetical protein
LGGAGCFSNTTSFVPPAGLTAEYSSVRGCFGGYYDSPIGYQFTVPNGLYQVTLKFAEPEVSQAGQRIFGVAINGATVLPAVDVAANAGGRYKPWDATMTVAVTGGQMSFAFPRIVATPIVNAIEILPLNSVEVLPGSLTLALRQTQQFRALTTGVANQAVTWSLNPNLGTITTEGVYTAPASLPANTTVTVTATSAANPTLSGSATITLRAVDPNSIAPIRINAGGPAYTDAMGRLWAADTGFSGGCSFLDTTSFTPPAGVSGEYGTVRGCFGGYWSPLFYQFSVPDGSYLATLKFAEPSPTTAGSRIFGVSINGATVVPAIDVIANAGGQFQPWDAKIPVLVKGGQITIGFPTLVGTAIVNAIEIQ